ncbi:MAG: GMP/IMP nucleotidase [Pseudomonadales bacterium]|nr:GMP/IMP nucleotidase [Pseudomonadales bacterium]
MPQSIIPWSEIETVLLDMDGTLLDLHFDNYFWLTHLPQVFSQKYSLDYDDAMKDLHQRFEEKRGSMDWYCLDFWTEQLQLDVVDLKHDVKHKIAIRPFVESFLQFLRDEGKHIVLLTNAHRDSLDLKMQETGLEGYFDQLISTHDYGLPKENIGLWSALKADCQFNPASTLLIDDTETVLDSAHRFGIKYLLTLSQPDSQNPKRDGLAYTAIHHFDEIMPHG